MKKEANMTQMILVGDRVRWDWPSGTKRGEVIQIFNTQDEFGDYINFYHISYSDGFGGTGMAMISQNEIEQFDLKVIFRDVENQIALGQRNADGSFRDYDREAAQYEYERMVEM